MYTLLLAGLTLLAQAGGANAPCSGPDLTIGSAAVKDVTPDGNLNAYHFDVTVVNRGTQAQPSNTLQFVDVYQNGDKLDAKGIPPLGAGQSYVVSYVSERSKDAGNHTSTLAFKLDFQQPSIASCDTSPSPFTVAF